MTLKKKNTSRQKREKRSQVKGRGRKTQRTQKENNFFKNTKSLMCINYNNIQCMGTQKHAS